MRMVRDAGLMADDPDPDKSRADRSAALTRLRIDGARCWQMRRGRLRQGVERLTPPAPGGAQLNAQPNRCSSREG